MIAGSMDGGVFDAIMQNGHGIVISWFGNLMEAIE